MDYAWQIHTSAVEDSDDFWFDIDPTVLMRPINDGKHCALMVTNVDGEPNGGIVLNPDWAEHWVLGLPFFFQYDIEVAYKTSFIALYEKNTFSPVTLATCRELEFSIYIIFCMIPGIFLWIFV